ncbi:hypothetical protein, partial [Aquitalea pelogenes]|uniref:hypothetical protein n=1 Tax=Aquitalea pelogenes TaxID=1293573 RepID=UPI0035B00B07
GCGRALEVSVGGCVEAQDKQAKTYRAVCRLHAFISGWKWLLVCSLCLPPAMLLSLIIVFHHEFFVCAPHF